MNPGVRGDQVSISTVASRERGTSRLPTEGRIGPAGKWEVTALGRLEVSGGTQVVSTRRPAGSMHI